VTEREVMLLARLLGVTPSQAVRLDLDAARWLVLLAED
jgi:hypothetical protein